MAVSNPESSIEDLLTHRDFVRALAAKLTRDPNAAEDLEQEAWVRALEHPPQRINSPRGWLTRVVRNLAFERHRRDRRRIRRERDRETASASPSAAEVHEQRRLRERLASSLKTLREEDRHAIELRCGEGLPPREISARTGIGVEEVYQRLRRGLGSMRKDLDQEYGDRRRWSLALLALVRGDQLREVSALAPAPATIGLLWKLLPAAAILCASLWIWSGGENPFADEALAGEDPGVPDVVVAPPIDLGSEVRGEAPVTPPRSARIDLAPPAAVAPDGAMGSLAIEVFWNWPRERAAGVPILVESFRDEDGQRHVLTTEPDGRTRVDLPAGVYTITPGRGVPKRIELAAAEERRLEVLIAHGQPLTAHVRKPDTKQHVPEAAVYVSWPDRPDTGYLLGRTNRFGTLILDDVSPKGWIWASAEGLGCSDRLNLTTPLDRSKRGRRVLLDLHDPAAPVVVRVVDSQGHPISGARVRLGEEARPRFGDEGSLRLPPSDSVGLTDESGSVRLASVFAARRFVEAGAPGHATARIELPADAVSSSIELQRAAVVYGTVYGPGGETVEGAYLRYSPNGEVKDFVDLRSDANGRYRIEGLSPGVVSLSALDFRLPRPDFRAAEFEVEPGEEREWSPRLELASGIGGRALDAHGQPLERWNVSLEASEDARVSDDLVSPRSTVSGCWTDGEGRFFFPYARADDHWVCLRSPRGLVRDWIEGVPLGATELELRATAEKRPDARIAGTIRRTDGKPVGEVEIHVRGPLLRQARRIPVNPRNGGFLIKDLNAARYHLTIWMPGYPARELPGHATVELAPGELRDLGEITQPPRLVMETE